MRPFALLALVVLTAAACRGGSPPPTGTAPTPAGQETPAARGGEGTPVSATPPDQREQAVPGQGEQAVPAATPVGGGGPGPVQGTLEPERTYAVGASGRNRNVELTVAEFRLLDPTRVVSSSGAHPARPDLRFVVLTTVWKNLVPPRTLEVPKRGPAGTVSGEKETVVAETAYVVPDLVKHLHLLIDRRYVAHVDPASARLPEALPLPRLVVERYNQEVRGAVAFVVPAGPFQSLTLQFYDFTQGHITVPVYGTPPAQADRPVAGPARNQVLAASVYGVRTAAEAGTAQAPAGNRFLLVDVGATSLAPGQIAQVDVRQFVALVEDGVYLYRPAPELPRLAHQFHGVVSLLPDFERRGVLAFVVPEQTGRLELLVAAARVDPVTLLLTPDVAARGQPQPKATIPDGEVAEVLLNGTALTDQVGEVAAPAGRRFLVLDLTVVNRSRTQGLVVQPVQFTVTDGQQRTAPSPVTAKLPHGLAQERVVPPAGRGRFEVAFEVPAGASSLRLAYQGFTKVEEVPLP